MWLLDTDRPGACSVPDQGRNWRRNMDYYKKQHWHYLVLSTTSRNLGSLWEQRIKIVKSWRFSWKKLSKQTQFLTRNFLSKINVSLMGNHFRWDLFLLSIRKIVRFRSKFIIGYLFECTPRIKVWWVMELTHSRLKMWV